MLGCKVRSGLAICSTGRIWGKNGETGVFCRIGRKEVVLSTDGLGPWCRTAASGS